MSAYTGGSIIDEDTYIVDVAAKGIGRKVISVNKFRIQVESHGRKHEAEIESDFGDKLRVANGHHSSNGSEDETTGTKFYTT